jgi:holin-like protein
MEKSNVLKKTGNLVYEILTIGLIYLAGEMLSRVLPVPASLISMVLFFILLMTRAVKADRYGQISALILGNISFFFLPPAILILDSMDIVSGNVLKILIVLILSSVIVMGVSGMVVQLVLRNEEKRGVKSDD